MVIAQKAICALTASLAVAAGLAVAASAAAAASAAHWTIISQPAPADFHAGDRADFYWISALNDGGAPTSGKITLKDTLPAGLTVPTGPNEGVTGTVGIEGFQYPTAEGMGCSVSGSPQTVECSSELSVPIGDRVVARIDVEVPEGTAGPLENTVTIVGGGAPAEAATSNSTPVVAAGQQAPYGAQFEADATQEDGQPATQAGSHPFAFSTQLAINVGKVNATEVGPPCDPQNDQGLVGCAEISGAPKDIEVQLPPGLVGNPLAVPRCSQKTFQAAEHAGCPASTQVGDVYLAFFGNGTHEQFAPVYNIEPPPGQPAELGFIVGGTAKIPMFFHVRSDGNYGLTVDLNEISDFDAARLASLMIWGVPAAEAHNPMRKSNVNGCEPGAKGGVRGCPPEALELPAKPFLTMPTSCSGQTLGLPMTSDSWEAPGVEASNNPEATLTALTGCEALSLFAPQTSEVTSPEIEVKATSYKAGIPAGYAVHLTLPHNENPSGLATPDVRDVEVTLPEGTVISPSAANGLVACSNEQFGQTTGKVGNCPLQSRIGAVIIHTPLLPEPLQGSVYVGQPECSPCSSQQAAEGKMVRLFIEAKMPEPPPRAERPAVLIKLAGRTQINQRTGRLTTVFENNPQLPFDELELELEHGEDAPLVNPSSCGPVSASAHLTAWSALFNGQRRQGHRRSEASITSSPLPIGGCSSPSFTPGLVVGMTGSARGGSFGSLTTTLARADGQQDLGTVALHLPPGLAAMISKVPLCSEAQANAGSCEASSQIGEVTTSVGAGSQPYTIRGGKVYLTGPYGGGPFGLSIVVPAEAGPYRLAGLTGTGSEGNGSVVIRGSIKIDPHTAAVTATTNPVPTQLDGIPLHIQKVIVNVNREGFAFNPTNCNAMNVEGTITSSTGTAVTDKYPFQSTDCAALPFKAGFKVGTRAHHTKRFGAYLHVTVTSGRGQANIKSVFVELPKVLPSRLETLKHACTEAQFAKNPAGCPASSRVGTAIARTPVLPVPLTGPAIFVSHGGAKFPDLDIVLQGDGVTVDLTGNTNIVKNITQSNFKSVPDVPVNSFELTLPTGAHSALAAEANLCTQTVSKRVKTTVHGKTVYRKQQVKEKRKLVMPTTITGQNGAVIKQSTVIAVQGCGGSKRKTTKAKTSKKR
jgi:hypothetical protein